MFNRVERVISYLARNFSDQVEEDELVFFLFGVDVIFSCLRSNMTGLEYFAEPERVRLYESSIEILEKEGMTKPIGPRGARRFKLKNEIRNLGFAPLEKMYLDWVIEMMQQGAGFESFKPWGWVKVEITDQLSIDFIQSLDLFEVMGK